MYTFFESTLVDSEKHTYWDTLIFKFWLNDKPFVAKAVNNKTHGDEKETVNSYERVANCLCKPQNKTILCPHLKNVCYKCSKIFFLGL